MHGKVGVKFKAGFTASKRKSMMRNLVSELIKYGHVTVTEATAKDLVSVADKMVTLGKKGDLAARRQAARYIRDIYVDEANKVTALQKLFNEIAPSYKDRNGGYTRRLKLVNRLGDNSPMCVVEFVK
ncbi:MAG: 50S ribosomal protein L17 [Bacilli bacterium]|nr:50S ribosomal protein L17 [Bacilli bacterium]